MDSETFQKFVDQKSKLIVQSYTQSQNKENEKTIQISMEKVLRSTLNKMLR